MKLHWARRSLWSNVMNLAPPPQGLRPDTRPEHQDAVNHMAQKKGEKKERKKLKKIIIIKKEESNQTNKQIHQ